MDTRNEIIYLNKLKAKKSDNSPDNSCDIDISDIIGADNEFQISEKRFETIKAIIPIFGENTKERYYVTDNGIPVFQVNEWLNTKNEKLTTGRKYSNIMAKYLNYLDTIHKEYWDADNNVVEDYILFMLYGGIEITTLKLSEVGYVTIKDNVMVIKHFYKWLSSRINKVSMEFATKEMVAKYSYLFGQIYTTDYDEIIEKRIELMPDSKEYIKWYTESEKNTFLSHFKTLRDKAIVSCTFDGGMRIDEVISIKVDGYNSMERTVTPSRSKSRKQDGKYRNICLSQKTCDIINNYFNTERMDAESESGLFNEFLFINLKKGQCQGLEISYGNFYRIFKRVAKKAGFPVEKVRTHSGRSTKTMELLEHQTKYPQDNMTDHQINMIMGWSNANSINSYKNHRNKVIGKSAQEKILKRKEEENEL